MLVFDVGTSDVRTGTGSPHTKSHPASGIVRLMAVMAVHGTTPTDYWRGATYGGVPMIRAGLAQDFGPEPGAAVMYWLGSGIPQGTQLISMDLISNTLDDIAMYGMSWTAAGDCYLREFDVVQGAQANPQSAMGSNGLSTVCMSAFYSGGLIAGSTILSGNTEQGPNNDAGGNFSYKFGRTTTADTTDKTIGWTAALNAVAMVNGLFAELPPQFVGPRIMA